MVENVEDRRSFRHQFWKFWPRRNFSFSDGVIYLSNKLVSDISQNSKLLRFVAEVES